jgi:hypothetical protein
MVSVAGDIIWQLPSAVAGSIITGTLNQRDLSRLDVACCAHTERTLYFGALRAGGRLSEVTAGNDGIDWVIERNVKVGKLKVQWAVPCLVAVARSHQLFETIELIAADGSYEPSELQNAFVLLSEIGHKVSFLSVWRFSNGKIVPDGVSLCNLLTLVVDYNKETSEWVIDAIRRNTLLRKVEIGALDPLSARLYDALLARCSTLTDLKLNLREGVTEVSFDRVAASCPGLQSLNLGCIWLTSAYMEISQGLVRLAEGCPDLRKLNVTSCFLRDDMANQAMLRGLKNLAVLHVQHTGMLFNDALLLALAECRSEPPYLTEMEITWYVQRTDTVARAAVVLNNLRRLDLYTNYPPPIDALEAGLAQLLRVEELTLGTHSLQLSKQLTAVAQGSPNLRRISMDCESRKSGAAGLIKIARHCPLLEDIHTIGGVISDRVLQALSQHCPRFRALSALHARCTATTAGLLDFIQSCPLLTTLELHVKTAVNDTVLQSLAQHSYYLEKLSLPETCGLSEEALAQVVVSCKHLHTLWSVMFPDLAGRLIQMAKDRGRKLKIWR